MSEPDGITVFAELTKEKNLSPVTAQLLSKARDLKENLWNQKVTACIIGKRMFYDDIIKEAGEYGADNVILVTDDRLEEYNPVIYGEIFTQIVKKYPPRIMLFGATPKGKEVASYAASKLETGLTADCSDLKISEDGYLISSRPTFGGQLNAEILCKTFPQGATVREATFKAEKREGKVYAQFENIYPEDLTKKIELISTETKKEKFRDLTKSKIIVAGGAGACKDNGFRLIYDLAQKLGAAVGGSREAVERGYVSREKQIGQTGTGVAPDLYIAVGISGANQHLTAIKNSGKIIAINNDADAPIFKSADIGIVGDLFEVIPKIIKSLDSYRDNEEKR